MKRAGDVDLSEFPTVQEQPVSSVITAPSASGGPLEVSSDGELEMSGYAYSGGGRAILRVDVSGDGGHTWVTARLGQGKEQTTGKAWAWTQWSADVKVSSEVLAKAEAAAAKAEEECDGDAVAPQAFPVVLQCRALDSAYNTQPTSADGTWNLRGLNYNAHHSIKVDIVA